MLALLLTIGGFTSAAAQLKDPGLVAARTKGRRRAGHGLRNVRLPVSRAASRLGSAAPVGAGIHLDRKSALDLREFSVTISSQRGAAAEFVMCAAERRSFLANP